MDVQLPPGAVEKVANQMGLNMEKQKLKVLDNLVTSQTDKKKLASSVQKQANTVNSFCVPPTPVLQQSVS